MKLERPADGLPVGLSLRHGQSQSQSVRGHSSHLSQSKLDQLARQSGVWRPWSQHQVAAAIAAHHGQHPILDQAVQQHPDQHQHSQQSHYFQLQHQQHLIDQLSQQQFSASLSQQSGRQSCDSRAIEASGCNIGPLQAVPGVSSANTNSVRSSGNRLRAAGFNSSASSTSTSSSLSSALTNRNSDYLAMAQQQPNPHTNQHHQPSALVNLLNSQCHHQLQSEELQQRQAGAHLASQQAQFSPPQSPSLMPLMAHDILSQAMEQPESTISMAQRNLQEQQLFNTLFRLIVAQFAQPTGHK